MPRELDYYDLLGVARDATDAEIRERLRVLAREAHPDRAPRDKKAEAEARFQEMTEAVNVLTNPQRRKAYDLDQSLAASLGSSGADRDSVFQNYLTRGSRLSRRGSTRRRRATFSWPFAATRETRKRSTTSAWPVRATETCAPP